MSDYNDCLLPEPCLRMDTHFGDEYESVEFGDGTGYVRAEPTLARLGALYVELDALQVENAKLREVVDAILQCAGETKRDKGCDACPMYNENGEALVRDSWCHLFSALHELGIKVDGQGRQVGSGDRPITAEFDGLIKDAPRFHAMGNSELIAYGYGMFAAGKKIEAENAKLRELARDFDKCLDTALYLADSAGYPTMPDQKLFASLRQRMRELGLVVDE